jgi:hypothetical protein
MGVAVAAGLTGLGVYASIADEKYPHWWIPLTLLLVTVVAALLAAGFFFIPRLRADRLAIEVAPSGMNVVSSVPEGHPRKGDNEGMVLLSGIRFTSLEDADVSLRFELVADFPDESEPVRLQPVRHHDDLPVPLNLTPTSPGITGELSFPWSRKLMARMGSRETGDVFSLRIVDDLTKREATIPLLNISVTDRL